MPVSQSAFCWPKFVLGREFPGHNRAPIWLTLVLLVGRRIKALSGKVFSLAVNAESPRKFPPPSVLVTISRKECLERCELATYAKHFRLLLRPLLPPRPRKLFRLSKSSTRPPHPQVSLSQPVRLPYSRSSTFAQLCSLLRPNLCCRAVWLSPFSLTAMCPNRILPFRLHLDPCSQRARLRKRSYVPSAFPRRWSVDRSRKAEPGCPASLLRGSTPETGCEMFLLGWQGGDLSWVQREELWCRVSWRCRSCSSFPSRCAPQV